MADVYLLFHRIVKSDPPDLSDFMSNAAQGKQLTDQTPDPLTTRMWDGLSVFDSEEGARQKAIAIPRLGRFIVTLPVLDQPGILWQRTGKGGHCTI